MLLAYVYAGGMCSQFFRRPRQSSGGCHCCSDEDGWRLPAGPRNGCGPHRCVITLVGDRETIQEAAIRGVGKAAELIDLTKHQGAHPRMGAADVVPFIPIEGV